MQPAGAHALASRPYSAHGAQPSAAQEAQLSVGLSVIGAAGASLHQLAHVALAGHPAASSQHFDRSHGQLREEAVVKLLLWSYRALGSGDACLLENHGLLVKSETQQAAMLQSSCPVVCLAETSLYCHRV